MTSLTPTSEQQTIIDAFLTGRHVAISAGAGTGKTSTLKLLAESRTDTKMLYVAYNKAIAEEAKGSFPSNVECRTAHSLAYGEVGKLFRDRLRLANISPGALVKKWQIRDTPVDVPATEDASAEQITISGAQQVGAARAALRRFVHSSDQGLCVDHVWDSDLPTAPADAERKPLQKAILALAEKLWADISSVDGELKVTHDDYLKMWALKNPDLTRRWSVILYDEAQDADPVVADIIFRQAELGAQIVAVGDSSQAIYGWRGSADVLHDLPDAAECTLQQSFRFGPEIAGFANLFLGQLDAPLRLVGRPDLASTVGPVSHPDAILCRSNAGAFSQVMARQASGERVALVGGGGDLESFARGVQALQAGRPTAHPELAVFASWQEVVDWSETEDGRDLRIWVRLVESFGTDALLTAIGRLVEDESAADTVVSTAHKAKGRQFGQVVIADDFWVPSEKNPDAGTTPAELMLAYVASTRAQHRLDPGPLAWVLRVPEPDEEGCVPVPAPADESEGKAKAGRLDLDLDLWRQAEAADAAKGVPPEPAKEAWIPAVLMDPADRPTPVDEPLVPAKRREPSGEAWIPAALMARRRRQARDDDEAEAELRWVITPTGLCLRPVPADGAEVA